MNLPWNKNTQPKPLESTIVNTNQAHAESDVNIPKGYTPKKGKPTPKRNDIERQQGARRNYYAAPATAKEARQKRHEMKNSMTKEEYKAFKKTQRAQESKARKEVNERMLNGEEAYLFPKDQGPERRFVRNYVDSHRYLMNFFMYLALGVLILMMVSQRNPQLVNTITLLVMGLMILMIFEGFLLGRRVNKALREEFPETIEKPRSIGWYAFMRASMPRRMRTPRPQVSPGKGSQK